MKERIKELIKDRTPVDRRSAIFNFSDQADYAPLLQVQPQPPHKRRTGTACGSGARGAGHSDGTRVLK